MEKRKSKAILEIKQKLREVATKFFKLQETKSLDENCSVKNRAL